MRIALALVLLLVGVTWLLQGFDVGFAPKSFMTGSPEWVFWGAMSSVGGAAILWWEMKSRMRDE